MHFLIFRIPVMQKCQAMFRRLFLDLGDEKGQETEDDYFLSLTLSFSQGQSTLP